MNLGELAIACYAYGAMTGFDDSLLQLERLLGDTPDLRELEHRQAMLKWLNQWQCRQFSLACHHTASAELLAWYDESFALLPSRDLQLWQIESAEIEAFIPLFDALAKKQASTRTQGDRTSLVTFGPTAAAKILFALRPRVFVAWDEPIRHELRHDGSGRSYVTFLLDIRRHLLDLRPQARQFGLELEDLPVALGRPRSTPAQLLDEYYWATKTRKVVLPERETVARWLEWYGA